MIYDTVSDQSYEIIKQSAFTTNGWTSGPNKLLSYITVTYHAKTRKWELVGNGPTDHGISSRIVINIASWTRDSVSL